MFEQVATLLFHLRALVVEMNGRLKKAFVTSLLYETMEIKAPFMGKPHEYIHGGLTDILIFSTGAIRPRSSQARHGLV